MGDAVGLVKCGYGGRKGREGRDFGVGKESVTKQVRY